MKRTTLAELQAMPTIDQGHTDDLKVHLTQSSSLLVPTKVWLSRLTKEDGMPYDHQVTVEQYYNHQWVVIDTYEAI